MDHALPHAPLQQAQALLHRGRLDEAEAHLQRHPQKANPAWWHLCGQLAAARHDYAGAAHAFRQALALHPEHWLSWLNLGLALEELERPEAAETAYRQALTLAPEQPMPWLYLADLLRQQAHLDEAEALLHTALRSHPAHPALQDHLALVHQARGETEAAEARWRRLLEQHPDHAPALAHLGAFLEDQERHAEAEPLLRRALALRPGHPDSHNALGLALRHQGHLEEALEHLRAAVAARPDEPTFQINLAGTLHDCGEVHRSLEILEQVMARHGESDKLRWTRAFPRLQLGHYAEGWDDMEAGLTEGDRHPRPTPYPRWDGGPLRGRLLVLAEQGIGDQIMFATCLPDLLEHLGPGVEVILECEPRLAPLFARSLPHLQVRPASPKEAVDWEAEFGPIAAHIPIGSLPRLFRRRLQDFPQRPRLLQADPEQVDRWRTRLAALGPGRPLGLSWQAGGLDHKRRNLDLDRLRPLLTRPDIHWLDMQYRVPGKVMPPMPPELHRWPDCDPFRDIDALAALMVAAGGVVTVANSNAHLAGALGVPTLVLAPFVPSWRWGLSGERSPWYTSVRLLRQPRPDDWETVLRTLAARLDDGFPAAL